MEWPGFIGAFNTAQSPIADGEALVNWYVAKDPAPALYPTPGFAVFADSGKEKGRGSFAEADRMWKVVSDTVFEVSQAGGLTVRGTVAQDQHPATISSNGLELFITSGDKGYCLDKTTNVFTTVLNSGATMGGCLSNVFIAFNAATGQARISGVLDGLTWDPTLTIDRSLAPDPWKSMVVTKARIYFLGEYTSEVWYDGGAYPVPFVPATSAIIPYGIAAVFGAGLLGEGVAWLGHNTGGVGTVLFARGVSATPIQTDALAWALGRYTTLEDAEVWNYSSMGHDFLQFDLPSAGVTWSYDAATGLWHTRSFRDPELGTDQAWRPSCHSHEWGVHIVGDRRSGVLYRMDDLLGLDMGGAAIRRLRRPPGLFSENQEIGISDFQVHYEPGLGLEAGQGSDPTMLMRMSRNGGKTYGSWRTRHAGKIGEYDTRMIWKRMPSGRHLVPEIVVSDPIPWRITGCSFQPRGASERAA